MQQFGFSAGGAGSRPAGVLAAYERAYKERATSESPQLRRRVRPPLPEQEPIPGIEFEYRIASPTCPASRSTKCRSAAQALITDDNRVVLAVAPEKKDVAGADGEATMRAAIARADSGARSSRGRMRPPVATLVEEAAAPAAK